MKKMWGQFLPFEYNAPLGEVDISAAVENRRRVHRVFCRDVHNVSDAALDKGVMPRRSRILFRPRREGKSTELQLVRHLFRRLDLSRKSKRLVHFVFDSSWRARGRHDLFERVASGAGVPKRWSLWSSLAGVRAEVLVLLFDDLENLSDDCLHWLLANAHDSEERQRGGEQQRRIYMVLAGNTSLSQLSRDIWSVFYTDEVGASVRGYEEEDLAEVSRQMDKMGLPILSAEARCAVRRFTAGAKRLTNLLCGLAYTSSWKGSWSLSGSGQVTREALDGAVQEYFAVSYRHDSVVQESLRLIEHTPGARKAVTELLKSDERPWGHFDPSVQKSLYNEGVVRIEKGRVALHSEFWCELLARCVASRRRTTAFLSATYPRTPVLPVAVQKVRRRVANRFREQAFLGKLLWLYYCEVADREGDVLVVMISGADGEKYVGRFPLEAFGVQLSAGDAFLRFCCIQGGEPKEEFVFYGKERGGDSRKEQ